MIRRFRRILRRLRMPQHRPGRKAEDSAPREVERLRQRVRELEADCETLRGQLEIAERLPEERRQRLLLELAMCPVSEEKIARCLKAAFYQAPSTGWINQQINRAGAAALARWHTLIHHLSIHQLS